MEVAPKNIAQEMAYNRAKKRAQNIRSFYINLTCYCIVIPVLVFINLKYSPEFLWFFFSMLGWGFGLLAHGMEAFQWMPFLGSDWEQRKFKELLEKEQKSKSINHGKS